MQPAEYKLERFSNPHFPIYLSLQSGRKTLVKIHHHSSAEIMQVLEGRIQLFVSSTRRECQKGDLIFVPPSAIHEVNGLTEDAAIRGVIYEPSLADVADLQLNFAALLGRNQPVPYIISPQDRFHRELCLCIDSIHALHDASSVAAQMRISACLLQMHSALIEQFALEERVTNCNYQKLDPVLSYLREHYADKIHISQLSRLIHVCDDHLIRLFKEVTGETPVAWLMNLRLEASLKLLSGTEDSIAAIAEQTGFGSATYMTRVFKQKLNTTPGRYRRK